jgi:PhnB protein
VNFMGKTEAAMNFYKSALGGEFIRFQRFKDMPGAEKMSASDREKIIHISLQIAKGIVIMGNRCT